MSSGTTRRGGPFSPCHSTKRGSVPAVGQARKRFRPFALRGRRVPLRLHVARVRSPNTDSPAGTGNFPLWEVPSGMTARAEKPRLPPIATKPVGHIPIVGTPLLRPQSLRVPFRGDPPPRRPPGPATEPTPSPTRRLTAEAWDDSARCVLKTSFLMASRLGIRAVFLPGNRQDGERSVGICKRKDY